MRKLISTLSGREYPFEKPEEFAENGEPLEVRMDGIKNARIKTGNHLLRRFSSFLPFESIDPKLSMGEGATPLLNATRDLRNFTGISNLLLKNETQNPTWSFKDRGSLTCMMMAKEMNEQVTATVSTGNMGNSMAAYGAASGIKVLVFVPPHTSDEKIKAMGIHGATIFRVKAPDYAGMKKQILDMASELNLRIVSGNNPIRVEGYKLTAFEMYEQMNGSVPDFIAVPTSACGHVRGIFKGYRELKEAGYIDKLPRMIVVQAANNSPVVTALKQGRQEVVPFTDFHTVAEAITTGNPTGGKEIIDKANRYGWLAEDVSEDQILHSQRRLAQSGLFVEPASATSLYAVKKLKNSGKIKDGASVVIMLTGAGMKDLQALSHHTGNIVDCDLENIREEIQKA